MKSGFIYLLFALATFNVNAQNGGNDDQKLFDLISHDSGGKYEFVQMQSNDGVFEQIMELKNNCDTLDLEKAKKEPVQPGSINDNCIKLEWLFGETFNPENIDFLRSQILRAEEKYDRRKNAVNLVRITKPMYNLSGNVAFVCSIRHGNSYTGVYVKTRSEWRFNGMLSVYIH